MGRPTLQGRPSSRGLEASPGSGQGDMAQLWRGGGRELTPQDLVLGGGASSGPEAMGAPALAEPSESRTRDSAPSLSEGAQAFFLTFFPRIDFTLMLIIKFFFALATVSSFSS